MIRAAWRRWFDRLRIRQKMIAITIMVTSVSVLVGAVLLTAVRANALLETEATRMQHIVAIAGDFSQAPLAFGDPAGATARLAYLQTIPEVLQAFVLDRRGEVFAAWQRQPVSLPQWRPEQALGISLWRYQYTVSRDIADQDGALGRIVILAGTRLLRRQVFEYLTALLLVVVIVMPVSVLVAGRLQATVSMPITHLAEVAHRVSMEGDYGLRVEPRSADETADLYRAFNEMMRNLQAREAERDRANAELRQVKGNLEDRVAERTEQLRAANRALAGEITRIQDAEAALSRTLTEKETLLREIHHRVKNNLQVIYSLLSLQMEGRSEDADAALLQDARQRIKTMALVHETLYGSNDFARIAAREFISSVAANLVRIYRAEQRGVQLQVAADDVKLDIDQAIPLGLIINELTTNALKYAFAGRAGGRLWISLGRVDAGPGNAALLLRVGDDGVGLAPGVDVHRPDSLGLKLVGALVQQLRGELTLRRDGVTEFAVRFPYSA